MNSIVLKTGIALSLLPALSQAKQAPKNVIFIAVDDLNDWVGFLGGHPQTKTPNMDRLAAMGMVFEKAYCAAPVSNASRAALLTGYRTSTTGVYGNAEFMRESEVLKEVVTLPKYFSNNGYTSMARGKVFHQPMGEGADPQSWDVLQNSGGKAMQPKKEKGKQANGLDKQTTGGAVVLDWAGVDVDEKETNDYLNAQWAAEQLMKKHDKPFFMACGIFRPHLPWYVPQKYFVRFPLESIQLPLSNNEDDMADIPERGLRNSGFGKPDHEYNVLKRLGLQKDAVRAYLACISYADDCIGQIVDALEKSPNRENTIVVLWGDHGWHLGEKMRYRKFSMWDRSCRMPLIIVAPGVAKPGSRCESPVNLLDLYPTMLNLAGLPRNPKNEGHDITALLKNPAKKWDIPSITTLGQNEHSIRTLQYRYIVYNDGTEELYDHFIDPLEWINLAKNPRFAKLKTDLRKHIPKVNVPSIGSSSKHKGAEEGRILWDEIDKEIIDYNKYLTLN
ncbi:MAG: sulfatase [Paludibacter sp.]|nr:sulfatase [Paludibacter sp.]